MYNIPHEGIKTDRRGIKIGYNTECGSEGHIEAGGSSGASKETAAEVEAIRGWKLEMSNSRVIKKVYDV